MCLKNCWTSGKKWRPRSDAALCGVWSGSTLFARPSVPIPKSYYGYLYEHQRNTSDRTNVQADLPLRCSYIPPKIHFSHASSFILVWEELTAMRTNLPNKDELTEEKKYEYELTEKWERERIDWSTNWLENELTSYHLYFVSGKQ